MIMKITTKAIARLASGIGIPGSVRKTISLLIFQFQWVKREF